MPDFDIAIIGLGAMGSASANSVARRGVSVVTFDQHQPPHSNGSTHGHTRIIREAYYEHPLYVPLVRRAYELWDELQREANTRLLVQTGGLMVGPERGPLFAGALWSARSHGIEHEVLDAGALKARFPVYDARPHWVGLYERRAGMLLPEKCVATQLAAAKSHGAELRLNEKVAGWRVDSRGVEITSASGTYRAETLIVAAGPWLPGLEEFLGVSLPLEIERQLSHWFEPVGRREDFGADRCPVALWEMPDGDVFATLPDEGHGVKCGMHHAGAPTQPDIVNRVVSMGENAVARELLEEVMPGAGGKLLDSRVCLYTNTPDHHFIIDWVGGDRVLLLSPCSGHGFKFASAIGEIAAQLVTERRTWIDLTPFSISRFAQASRDAAAARPPQNLLT